MIIIINIITGFSRDISWGRICKIPKILEGQVENLRFRCIGNRGAVRFVTAGTRPM